MVDRLKGKVAIVTGGRLLHNALLMKAQRLSSQDVVQTSVKQRLLNLVGMM